MKPIILLFLFFATNGYSVFAQPNNNTPYHVLDIQHVSDKHAILTCLDEYGRTIQVDIKTKLGMENAKLLKSFNDRLSAITTATIVKANLNTGKAWIDFNYSISYNLLIPNFSPLYSNITRIARITYDKKNFFLTAKQDTANGLTFLRIVSWYPTPDIRFRVGDPVYEKNYNNSRYGILKGTLNKYLSYSYPIQFATYDWYNSQPLEQVNSMGVNAPAVDSTNNPPQTQKLTTSEQSWDIKMDSSLTGIGGQIMMEIPKDAKFQTHIKIFEAGDTKKIAASWFGNNKSKLLPGLYDVAVDDKYTITNVPVEAGKKTRLRMGVLQINNYGSVQIENSDHQKFSYAPPFKIVLPEGTYYLNGNKKIPIVIKDGEVTKL
jgi:hypothetical protein